MLVKNASGCAHTTGSTYDGSYSLHRFTLWPFPAEKCKERMHAIDNAFQCSTTTAQPPTSTYIFASRIAKLSSVYFVLHSFQKCITSVTVARRGTRHPSLMDYPRGMDSSRTRLRRGMWSILAVWRPYRYSRNPTKRNASFSSLFYEYQRSNPFFGATNLGVSLYRPLKLVFRGLCRGKYSVLVRWVSDIKTKFIRSCKASL